MQSTDFKRTKSGACRRGDAHSEVQHDPLWNDKTTTRLARCVVVLPFAKVKKVVVPICEPLTGKYFSKIATEWSGQMQGEG